MIQVETVLIAAVAAATLTITGLIGIVLQQGNTRDLRSEMRSEISFVRSDMVSLRTQVHADLVMIHERVAKIEAQQS